MVVATAERWSSPVEGRPAAISIGGLTKRYANGTLANDSIDLDVGEGMTLGLLGRNGAGKTTLVRQITGELAPTAGQVLVLGIDVTADPMPARYEMGVVPQEVTPYGHLTPMEHLVFFGRIRGLSRAEAKRKAGHLIDMLGLGEHLRKRADMLSGGLKRKLLVGTALIGEPRILVLDEPTTGLDPHARHEVWDLLRTLRGRGRTVVMTTHYMEEAEELCDEVALISSGKLFARGTVDDLRARCRNRFKASYGDGEARHTVFGDSSEGVLGELQRLGVEEFSLMRTSLEDVYMELTAQALEAGS